MTSSILYSGGINCQWQLKVKCDYFNLFLYLFSLFLVTVTVLCDGGINCRWQLKVKCDYFYLFLYLFSLFFSDCHHIVWWRNQLSVATQGKMWLFLFVDIEDWLPSGCLPSRHWQCMALFREKAVLTDIICVPW